MLNEKTKTFSALFMCNSVVLDVLISDNPYEQGSGCDPSPRSTLLLQMLQCSGTPVLRSGISLTQPGESDRV